MTPAGLAVAVLVVAGVAAYGNACFNPFVFDDATSITDNPSIRSLARMDRVLAPVEHLDYYRPTLNLSLAICYALGGYDVVAYHVMNILIHVSAALTLFGLVRRTLQLPGLRDRFGDAATALAFAVALLWMLHPLQTESVTYVVQRCEAMCGLFCLLTIYATLRAATSSRSRDWYVLAVVACALGMGSKEASAITPGLVLLYDRIFLADSWRDIVLARWKLYLGLASTWLILLPMVLVSELAHDPRALQAVSVWEYARTQLVVVVHYLRLACWPDALCLDYRWPVAQSIGEVLPAASVMVALMAVTVWAVCRAPRWGFLGIFFFATLAPSSSVIPIPDLAFEHRMYLPLAPLVAAVVLGVYALVQRTRSTPTPGWDAASAIASVLLVAAATGLGTRTFWRNHDYRSDVSIWRDTVSKAPENPRAHYNLGYALVRQGELSEGIACYRQALALRDEYAMAHNNLGEALVQLGDIEHAIPHYQRAIEIDPASAAARNNLGHALLQSGRIDEAVGQLQQALKIEPRYANAHNNLGRARMQQGRLDEAITHYRAATDLAPEDAQFHHNLSHALAQSGQIEPAIKHGQQALMLRRAAFGDANAEYASSLNNLGLMYRTAGDLPRAESLCRRAVEIWASVVGERHPDYLAGLRNLAMIYHSMGDAARGDAACQRVLAIDPTDPQAHYLLGVSLQRQGRDREAVDQWRQALDRWPTQVNLLTQLAWALATSPDDSLRDGEQAVRLAERAAQVAAPGEAGGASVGWPDAGLLDVRAAAYAEAGQYERAAEIAEQALTQASSNPALSEAIRERLALYRSRSAYRSPR